MARLVIKNVEIRNALSDSNGAVINNAGTLNITNTSFIDNRVVGNLHGAAIYSTAKVTIYANAGISKFSRNYLESSNTYEAIYMNGSTLALNSVNGGSIVFDDKINGSNDYKIAIDGDNKSFVRLNNAVENASISLANTNLVLNNNTDFSSSSLDAKSGSVSLQDGILAEYDLGVLTSSASVKYLIDMKLENSVLKSDTISVASGSTGVITIDSISGLNIDSSSVAQFINNPVSVQILFRANSADTIKLALSQTLADSFNKAMSPLEYYDEATQKYIIHSSDFLGAVGLKLNEAEDGVVLGVIDSSDILATVNKYTPSSTSPQKDRYFILGDNEVYTVKENTGVTGKVGTMYLQGGEGSIIDYSNIYSGFSTPDGAKLDISNVMFRNALSTDNGAVISNSGIIGASTETGIVNSMFISNRAVMGGAIYNTGTIYSIKDTSFANNVVNSTTTSAYGGAIYNTGTINRILGGEFRENSATSSYFGYGGAIYNTGSIGTISTSFYDNYASGANAYGGAIYSSADIRLLADSQDYVFKGNYTSITSSATKNYNAIYMSNYNSTLTIQADNGGSWSFYDAIDGAYGYTVRITSDDGSGVVNLYNQITNAQVVTNNVNISLSDNAFTTYTFNSLNSTLTNLSLDLSYADRKADVIKVGAGSTGTITISELVGLEKSDILDDRVIIQILDKDDSSSIVLALTQEIQDKYLGEIDMDKYLDSETNTYIVKSTDYIGTTGIQLNAAKDSVVFGRLAAVDALMTVNQLSSIQDRYFVIEGAHSVYTAIGNTGLTALSGKMYVQGETTTSIVDGIDVVTNSVIDYDEKYSGFIVCSGGKLSISNITFRNAVSSTSGAVISNSGSLELDNVVFENTLVNAVTTINGSVVNNASNVQKFNAGFVNNRLLAESANIFGGVLYNSADIENMSGSFTGNYAYSNEGSIDGGVIFNAASIYNITGTFENNKAQTYNKSVHGGVIYNQGTLGHYVDGTYVSGEIIADFIGNSAVTDGSQGQDSLGGAIYNYGSIESIISQFSGNYSLNYSGLSSGGAIYNLGTLSNVSGSFDENYAFGYDNVDSVLGGAIVNKGTMTKIDASFTGNYARSSSYYAYGGAIENQSYINTISGNFTANYVMAIQYGGGGAIDNNSQIYTISGDFSKNYVTATNYATAGAIFNSNDAYIGDISGEFSENYVISTAYNATGGAITSAGTIRNITGNFINNSVTAALFANGGAIYNTGSITNISASFIGNSAIGVSGASGGAIYTNSDLRFVATNQAFEISGNYVSTDGGETKTYQAVYVDAPYITLTFNLLENGSYTILDNFAGSEVYDIIFNSTDRTGSVIFSGELQKANVTIAGASFTPSINTFGNDRTTVNANAGNMILQDNTASVYTINKLVSQPEMLYAIDIDSTNMTADKMVLGKDSEGTVTINSVAYTKGIVEGTFQLLNAQNENIQLAVGDNLNNGMVLLTAIINWNTKISTGYVYRLATIATKNDSLNVAYQNGIDLLSALNQFDTADERHFVFSNVYNEYVVAANTGKTAILSPMYVDGIVGQNRYPTINYRNEADRVSYSGFILGASARLYIEGVRLENAQSTYGSVIYGNSDSAENKAIATIWDGAFESNRATYGGAIFANENTTIDLVNKVITEYDEVTTLPYDVII
ncbi:MAG: hypothetical protein NC200_06855, partial [Candidatus Gastranaerophilales bacterium]|nr:hypothetical protein [Candidatus Gastranaerophilales bacterium]